MELLPSVDRSLLIVVGKVLPEIKWADNLVLLQLF